MTIRNGSTKDTDTEPQQPTPVAPGQFLADSNMTKASIGLAAAGGAAFAYSLATGCSLPAGITGIVLALASAVVEGINLALGPRRERNAPRLDGAQLPQALVFAGSRKRRLRPGEQWDLTFAPNTVVVFCEPRTGRLQAMSGLINNPNAVVTLKNRSEKELSAAPGLPEFYVEET